eukprot:ANDGO_01268.mRNA.1 hypothetical protein
MNALQKCPGLEWIPRSVLCRRFPPSVLAVLASLLVLASLRMFRVQDGRPVSSFSAKGCRNASLIEHHVHALQASQDRLIARLKRINGRFSGIEDVVEKSIPTTMFDLNYRQRWAPLPANLEELQKLPRVAIVNAVTPVWAAGYELEQTAMNCYAAYQGYPNYVETVALQPDRFISSGRLRGMQKYLPYFQWVLHASADMTVVNRSKRIESYLDDRFDVILTRRNFYQLHNSRRMLDGKYAHYPQLNTELLMVKNTQGGRTFVNEFMSLSDEGRYGMVWDMGELHEVVIKLLFPEHYEECARPHIEFRHGTYKPDPSGEHPLDDLTQHIRKSPCASLFTRSEWKDGPVKIKILDMGVMVRDHEQGSTIKLLRCSDFFVHTKGAVSHLTADEVYCLPLKEHGVARPDRYLSETESGKYARDLGCVYDGCTGINIL